MGNVVIFVRRLGFLHRGDQHGGIHRCQRAHGRAYRCGDIKSRKQSGPEDASTSPIRAVSNQSVGTRYRAVQSIALLRRGHGQQ
jgi:hypothetical protein